MNLTEIRHILEAGNIRPSKALGQNFLHDLNQIRRIVAAAELSGHDRVLEIGPGLGALTQLLLEKAPQVIALERDQRLLDFLRQRWPSHPGLTLVHTDALAYLQQSQTDWSEWKLVSNLPYSVASSILVQLAKTARGPVRIAATLQLEVAHKLAAGPREDDYGVLSLLVQSRYDPVSLFKIPAACFYPAPEIDSACVTLIRRPTPLLEPTGFPVFEKIVKRAFSQRRKMMLKLLKADWPMQRLQSAFAEMSIPAQARAETLSLNQFVELTRRFLDPPPAPLHETRLG